MTRVLFIEPYYGDSHAHLVDGLMKRLPCECELLSMSPRKWKWRMRGGTIYLAKEAGKIAPCDIIFAGDFLDLPVFLALGPKWLSNCRKIVYFHENQLTYPVQVEDERDFHFGLTNVTTALTADRIAFNSEFHRREFIEAIGEFIKKFPDYRPKDVGKEIKLRSSINPIPLDIQNIPRKINRTGRLRILWNQRWEFDKAPETLFEILFSLVDAGVEFEIVVAGEVFKDYPEIFDVAEGRLRSRIVSWGYIENRRKYLETLADCDVVVSTAIHEFFGIAVAEAVAAGCRPLLPRRLAYTDIYPDEFLYSDEDDFQEQLRKMATCPEILRNDDYRKLVEHLDWREQIQLYEDLILNW